MCHYLGGGLHGRKKRVKAQSESSKSVVNSVLISREMPVFPGFLEIIRVVIKKIEEGILFLFLAVILLACFFQVIGRYTPLPFSSAFEEIAVNLFIWMTLLGAGVCVRTHSHMRMDIIDTFLPEKIKPYVDMIRELIVGVVFGYAAIIVASYIPVVKRTGMTTSSLDIPQYILYYAMPVGFGLMVFWSIVNIVMDIKKIRNGDAGLDESDSVSMKTE